MAQKIRRGLGVPPPGTLPRLCSEYATVSVYCAPHDRERGLEDLRRMREEAGFTQAGLARASGVDRVTINKVEQGKRSPSIETLEKLARAMGVEIGDFFPKVRAPLPESEGGRRQLSPPPDYEQLANGLDRITEYWKGRLERGPLDRHAFEAFHVEAEGWTRWLGVVWDLERSELGVPENTLSGGRLWPAIDRYIALGLDMFQAEEKVVGTVESGTIVRLDELRRRKAS